MKKTINYTSKGYSYIECTKEECFGWGGMCICDNCNKYMNSPIYLVFILGRALCKDCFEDWSKRGRRYEEDIQIQNQSHIEYYRSYGFEV